MIKNDAEKDKAGTISKVIHEFGDPKEELDSSHSQDSIESHKEESLLEDSVENSAEENLPSNKGSMDSDSYQLINGNINYSKQKRKLIKQESK